MKEIRSAFQLIVPITFQCEKENTLPDFSTYFASRPLKPSFQLNGSILLDKQNSPLKACFELQQKYRKEVGLHANENWKYTLVKENITFQLQKLKLWLFQNGIGFFTFEIHAEELPQADVLDLFYALSNIRLRRKIKYRRAVSKEVYEDSIFRLEDVIRNLLKLQDTLPLHIIENETFNKAHCLFYGFSDVNGEESMGYFLEMLRNQQRSSTPVAQGLLSDYRFNAVRYITWAASEKVLAAIGDTASCGETNELFLKDSGGLMQTAFANYLPAYLNCLSVHLKLHEIERTYNIFDKAALESCPHEVLHDLKDLLNTPLHDVTSELRINELLREVLCARVLKLQEKLDKLSGGETFQCIIRKLEEIEKTLKEMNENLKDWMTSVVSCVDKQKGLMGVHANAECNDDELEQLCAKFIRQTSEEIAKIACRDIASVDNEEAELRGLFGPYWDSMDSYSKSALISAKVFLSNCTKYSYKVLDYSGVIISATSALENELSRRFFTGYQKYLLKQVGNPNVNTWPETLLYRTKNGQYVRNDTFTMGSLPHIFNCAEHMDKLEAYLRTILSEPIVTSGSLIFTEKPLGGKSFIYKCESVRTTYRNPAAHTDPVSLQEAQNCCTHIIGLSSAAEKVGQIQGLLLELLQKTDRFK